MNKIIKSNFPKVTTMADLAELRKQNAVYHLKKPYTHRSGDGFTMHVNEKYEPFITRK